MSFTAPRPASDRSDGEGGIAGLLLGPDQPLDCERLERAAVETQARVSLSPAAQAALKTSWEAFLRSQTMPDAAGAASPRRKAAGAQVFTAVTGRGGSAGGRSALYGKETRGTDWPARSGAIWDMATPEPIVRAAMLVRAQALAQGGAEVRAEVVERYLALLASGLTPVVPEIGSMGASGDVLLLAHIASVLTGEGDVWFAERRMPARQALIAVGLTPLELEGQEVQALTNAASFRIAYAALVVARFERLLRQAELLTGWIYRALGCRLSALDPQLHRSCGHAGQVQSAETIRTEALRDGSREDRSRSSREIDAICYAPQMLGACRENLDYARRLIEIEMNRGVGALQANLSDADEAAGAIRQNGQVYSQQIAFAADACNSALIQVGLLVEQQIDALLDPRANGGVLLRQEWEPGVPGGLAGAQLIASGLVAEMCAYARNHAGGSLPFLSGHREIASFGASAACEAYRQTERLAAILAVLGVSLRELDLLRAQGLAPGASSPPPPWMPSIEPLDEEQLLRHELAFIADAWLAP